MKKESQADEIENQINELDKNYKLDLNKIEGADQFDTEKLNAYIDQQMAKKMDELKQDVGSMLDAMQLEVIRQFQIQRGTVNNLLNQYMIDEQTVLQEDMPIGNKYLQNDNMSVERAGDASSEGSGPDYIYLQEYQEDDMDY